MAMMGGNPDINTQTFVGRVADFAIFDRALTDAEVLSIYIAPNGLEAQTSSQPCLYISGLKRLLKGEGNLVDSSPIEDDATPTPHSSSTLGHGITFPTDSFGTQSSR